MIILLYGADEYRRFSKLEYFKQAFREKHSYMGIDTFDLLLAEDIENFQVFIRNESLFSPFKLAVLTSLPTQDDECTRIAKFLKEFSKHKTVTVIISLQKKPTKNFSFVMPAAFSVHTFPILDVREWESFVKEEANSIGVELTRGALAFLSSAYEGDSWRLVTELQKLQFVGRVVSEDDLEQFGLEITPNIWNLLAGVKSSLPATRLVSLERVLGENEPPAKLFSVLAYQLPKSIERFAGHDVAIKSGKLDYEDALVDLAIW